MYAELRQARRSLSCIMSINMSYSHKIIADTFSKLKIQLERNPGANPLRAPEFKALAAMIPKLPSDQRASFGKELNQLKAEIEEIVLVNDNSQEDLEPIDITAPFDVNTPINKRPGLLNSATGSRHPLMSEIELISDIFARMGFVSEESRWLDDEHHMFDTLNFPTGHPARYEYDTFTTIDGLLAPAHTSTMQNRMLKKYKPNLVDGKPIAVLIPDRVYRNEDVDARHDHTFYQYEGIYVDKGVNAGMLIATLKAFFQEYYGKELNVRIQPFYFPFTEPSFEFISSCVFCNQKGCSICSHTGWIELGGCGMIHPNVLKMGGIDPEKYTGFAWGFGVDRTVMLKHGIEDVRHFESGRLDFLRQF